LDLYKIIDDLQAEKRILDRTIAELEKMQQTGGCVSFLKAPRNERRGRKAMGQAEREQVSARMKRYWAGHRRTLHAIG